THKSKERSEVSGGGKKPWKQKGRGGARAGTSRSPIWVGGGTIFGPKPHTYKQKLNKKVLSLARKSALSYKAKANQIMIVEDFNLDAPKTKEIVSMLNALKVKGKRTLLLTNGNQDNVYKSGRNITKVHVLEANKASAYDLLNNQVLLVQKSAVNLLENTIN
ncbi:MAG: 50S ribosomal protein L4, partial [Melioribacteraceae bacterium]